jgi:hypothetical protein
MLRLLISSGPRFEAKGYGGDARWYCHGEKCSCSYRLLLPYLNKNLRSSSFVLVNVFADHSVGWVAAVLFGGVLGQYLS